MLSNPTRLLLLTTCGTSVLSNQLPAQDRSWLTSITNLAKLEGTDRMRLQGLCERAQADSSAELDSIAHVLKQWSPDVVQHLLVHSDTAVGLASAQRVQEALPRTVPSSLLSSGGLRTDNIENFRAALSDLLRRIVRDLDEFESQGYTVVFNLTGGFKSVNAYLQTYGMLRRTPCVFLFERSGALMEIPRLPIRIDAESEFRDHLAAVRKMQVGYAVSLAETKNFAESLLLTHEGQVQLSEWGEMLWLDVRTKLLGQKLQPSLSESLSVSPGVVRSAQSLSVNRRLQVQDTLDALAAHLDGKRVLLKSNTFKKLQGNPKPPSTHEIYAWSDGGAGRLFGHYENSCFVVDHLDGHL